MKSILNMEYGIEFKQVNGQAMVEEVQQLFLEYAASLDIDLAFQDFANEFKSLPGKYGQPSGALILALVDGKGVGCIALRKISEDICEMKRLYVRDEYKGRGIGKRLIHKIIGEARQLGYKYIRLDTLPTMKTAQDLYSFYGFYEIESYVFNPIVGAKFMELCLKD